MVPPVVTALLAACETLELRFRALLTEDATRQLELITA